jgi:NAD(P)-dependent dehydrogenase (short-subunit alcohol dehydrogenase family)
MKNSERSSGAVDAFSAFSVAGQRIWVTGASRGLGCAISRALAAAGADVALTARSKDDLSRVADEAREYGREALVLPASVSDAAQVAAVAAAIDTEWGKLDTLVNCAGVSPIFKRAESVAEDEWRHVIDVNLTGTFLCAKAGAALMIGRGGGSIVNISSIHGRVGMARLAAYSASKGGLEALTRTLALEWADHDIRVNSVAPGYIETDMTEGLREHEKWRPQLLGRIPLGRFGVPTEVTSAIVYLASPASRYVTGSTVTIDGGWTAS